MPAKAKNLLSKAMHAVAAVLGILILSAGLIAYFVVSFDSATQQYADGFGRQLGPSPFFMRFIFGQDRLWAGWGWWLVDMIWFWGGVLAAFSIGSLAQKLSKD